MEELQRKKTSRKGYRSHLTHLFKKVDAIMDSEGTPSEKDFTTLTSSIDQLHERAKLLQEADQEIANTITGEDELEAEIVESAAIQEMICDKKSQIKSIIHKLTGPTTTTPPVTLNVSAAEFVPPQHPTVREPPAQLLTVPPTARQPVSRLPKLTYLPSLGIP